MTTYDPNGMRLLDPLDDPQAHQRAVRLRELGLGTRPEVEFDEFARTLAEITGAPNAMVNFRTESEQYLAGLFETTRSGPPARVVPLQYGYCPHVVARRKALVLDDVCDYPRFAGNPVVDDMCVRAYLGAPLIDRTGTILGTVCVVDSVPRPWGRPGLETIKAKATELMELIHQRERS